MKVLSIKYYVLWVFIVVLLILTSYPVSYAFAETTDEKAVERLNKGEIPFELSDNPSVMEKNIFEKIADFFGKLLGFIPGFPEILYPRSSLENQSNLPDELKPVSKNPIEQIAGFLNNFYKSTLPDNLSSSSATTKEWEKNFEKANFPENIKPITGQ